MSYLDEYVTSAQLVDFQSLYAVFVDLDDTIVDYRNCSIYGLGNVKRMVPELSKVDLGALETRFRELLRDHLPDLLDGKYSAEEEREMRMGKLLQAYGVKADEELSRKCYEAFAEGFWSTRSLMDGAYEMLEIWKELALPVVIITNGNLEMQEKTLELLGLQDRIHSLLTPTNSNELKPNPGLFQRALEITGAEREKTVMIGDTWQQDILGAANAGIKPVWINSRMVPRPEPLHVLEVKSLRELFQLIDSKE